MNSSLEWELRERLVRGELPRRPGAGRGSLLEAPFRVRWEFYDLCDEYATARTDQEREHILQRAIALIQEHDLPFEWFMPDIIDIVR